MATIVITPQGGQGFQRYVNMFRLKRLFDNIRIDVEYGKRTQQGTFLLKLAPEQDIQKLRQIDYINGVKIKITMPEHMNMIKGIIYHSELAYMDAEEVKDMLDEYNVERVDKPPEAPYAVCSWHRSMRTELPSTVLVGWDRVKVKPCIPRPRRCYCCHTYGHIAADCTKTPVCARCGQDHDSADYESCQRTPHCAACGGSHAANDPDCPTWKEEKKVAKIRYEDKLSYSAAVKKMKKQEEEAKKEEEDKKEEEEEQEEDTEEESEEEDEGEEEQEEEAMQEEAAKKEEDKNRSQRGRPIEKTTDVGWQLASSKKRKTHYSST